MKLYLEELQLRPGHVRFAGRVNTIRRNCILFDKNVRVSVIRNCAKTEKSKTHVFVGKNNAFTVRNCITHRNSITQASNRNWKLIVSKEMIAAYLQLARFLYSLAVV